jgi:two-component system LytT family response regulator
VREKLRVVVADDERPARAFLVSILRSFGDVELVGEATTGREALTTIERTRPDLALLDLQMPEIDGLGVVRLLKKGRVPLIAFVTAYDEYAVRAFELNAIDYLLKPVDKRRLRQTLDRALERAEELEAREDLKEDNARHLRVAVDAYEASVRSVPLERIPVRSQEDIVFVAVSRIMSIVADGELLHLTTTTKERYTINYRLKDLETKLDPGRFIRLSRGTLANVDHISKISAMPSGTYVVVLSDGQRLQISRIQTRLLRERLFKL